jgi:S-adenosylmethionine synthetase
MKEKKILTAESVTEGHPDKLCDRIADAVLDACLAADKESRVACEVLATAGKIVVAGEITCSELPDIPHIVCKTIKETGYTCDYEVEVILHKQSEDIAGAVENCSSADTLGAGDQGIMYGYACNDTAHRLPLPVVLAHRLTILLSVVRKSGIVDGLLPDGKAQVSVEYEDGIPTRATSVIVSAQHEADADMEKLRKEIMEHVVVPAMEGIQFDKKYVLINPSGRFVLGGFEADTGLTGRKLMVDTYGGIVPHGGGALSGKDGTKVDRSGAYMARYIAKNIVAARLAEECTVSLAYAIGKPEPVAVCVDTHETSKYDDEIIAEAVKSVFDMTPAGIIRAFGLTKPIFESTSVYGHFTDPSYPWEQTNRRDELRIICSAINHEKMHE